MFRHTDASGKFRRFDSATNWSSTSSPIQSFPLLLVRLNWTPSKPSSFAKATAFGLPSRSRFQSGAPKRNFTPARRALAIKAAGLEPIITAAPAAAVDRNCRRVCMSVSSEGENDLAQRAIAEDGTVCLGGVFERE